MTAHKDLLSQNQDVWVERQLGKDPFEGDDFDPIKYINDKFPDENSLVNLDSVIGELKGEVSRLDEEILEGIHEHAMLNSQMKVEIANTKNLTSTIVQEIKSIKEKAIQSENIVHDMCMDIKLLDTAKRNLTTSINTLRKFSDLMRSLDNLRDFCADREYDEAANCLKGINDLLTFFKPFESIPQIKEMIEERDLILTKAKDQIKDDFSMFFKGTSSLSTETLKNGCHLVEIIGPKFRNDIMMMPAELILEPYRKIYSKAENNTVKNIEQRYAWFVKELREFNEKYAQAFPHYWGLINYITQNFATTTRVHIAEMLSVGGVSSPEDVRCLTNALLETKKFEQKIAADLAREYQQYLGEERPDKDDKQQYRFCVYPFWWLFLWLWFGTYSGLTQTDQTRPADGPRWKWSLESTLASVRCPSTHMFVRHCGARVAPRSSASAPSVPSTFPVCFTATAISGHYQCGGLSCVRPSL